MATTPNYGFVMPDPTDFVTNLPADFEIFGDEVDSRIKALNPETTLGDISYRGSTANAKTRLGIGTTGQVLTVSGGVPAWATPATGGDNWTLLNTGGTTLSGSSTITISGISGREKLMILISAGQSLFAGNFGLRINNDSGNNYRTQGLQLRYRNPIDIDIFKPLDTGLTSSIPVTNPGGATRSDNVSAAILITGGLNTGIKAFQLSSGQDLTAAGNHQQYSAGGIYNGSAAITSVSLVQLSSQNFNSGTIWVYGA